MKEIYTFIMENSKLIDSHRENLLKYRGFGDKIVKDAKLFSGGAHNAPLEAIFQIEATPSSTDVGKYMELIKDTFLKAIDDFTAIELGDSDNAINTQLPDDTTVTPSQGVVLQ